MARIVVIFDEIPDGDLCFDMMKPCDTACPHIGDDQTSQCAIFKNSTCRHDEEKYVQYKCQACKIACNFPGIAVSARLPDHIMDDMKNIIHQTNIVNQTRVSAFTTEQLERAINVIIKEVI